MNFLIPLLKKLFSFLKPFLQFMAALLLGHKIAKNQQTKQELNAIRKARKIERANRDLSRDDVIDGL
ncbi:MAG: hypothetical protein VKL60_18060 [Sphaerospermopsis sp.]|nr:hypothetical protein [Sphaerospermopsis sp.]